MKVIKGTFYLYKKFLPYGILGLILGIVFQVCGMMLPKITALIVDYGLTFSGEVANSGSNPFLFLVDGRFGERGSAQLLTALLVAFVLLMLLKHVCQYFRNFNGQRYGMLFNKELRFAAVRKLLKKNMAVSAGATFTYMNNDTVNLKMLYCIYLPYLLDSVLIFVLAFVLLAGVNPLLMIAPAVFTPFLVLCSLSYIRDGQRVTNRTRTCFIDLTNALQENFTNIGLVKQYGREELEDSIFRGYNRRHKLAGIKQSRVQTKYVYLFNVLRALTYVSSLAVGSWLAIQGRISVGNFLELITYVYLILDAITNFTTYLFNCLQTEASGLRYLNFLDSEEALKDEGTKSVSASPVLRFENAGCRLDGTQILEHWDLDIPYGSKIGLTGSFGAGKTVALKMLNRFVPVTEGRITLDGVPLEEIRLRELRGTFAQVFQEKLFFCDTIRKNVSFGDPDASDERIREIMDLLGAKEELDALPEGLDTVIRENASNLSENMINVIALTRAVLYDAPIYLLDDPFKDISDKTTVGKNLMALLKGKTVIMASNEPDQFRGFDEILFLERGEIAERGTHRELMAKKGRYAQICRERRSDR